MIFKKWMTVVLLSTVTFSAGALELNGKSKEDGSACFFNFMQENGEIIAVDGKGYADAGAVDLFNHCEGFYCLKKGEADLRLAGGDNLKDPEIFADYEFELIGDVEKLDFSLVSEVSGTDNRISIAIDVTPEKVVYKELVKGPFGIFTMAWKDMTCNLGQ